MTADTNWTWQQTSNKKVRCEEQKEKQGKQERKQLNRQENMVLLPETTVEGMTEEESKRKKREKGNKRMGEAIRTDIN